MKKLAIAVRLFAVALAIGATACSQADKNADATAAAPAAAAADDATTGGGIRYLNLDTVFANYTLAQEISKEGQKLMLDYQNLERQKQGELQRLGSSIEQKRNSNGYLSQESFDADVNNFNKKQNEAANVLGARQNSISAKMAERQKVLQDSLDNFLRDFNATRHYDAILLRESGVYFNPALDITQEVIAGLNARYKAPAADASK
ncbi:MAG: OmpH family outer membrane protein [Muribaculaceae bacterium]|nr:OmpH family outer membrane protein [Muribaculaceae bacterium]MDE6486139.1 OmpH family outer membrane protein [Muribaculaceae bacterium]